MSSKTDKINSLKNHFLSFSEGKGHSKLSEAEFSKLMFEDKEVGLGVVLQGIANARNGIRVTENGREQVAPINVSFSDYLKVKFGGDINTFLASFGIYGHNTIAQIAERFSDSHFDKKSFAESLESVSKGTLNFGDLQFVNGELSYAGSPQSGSTYLFSRGIVGELLIDMINRDMYESPYKKWIMGTESVKSTINQSAFSLKKEGRAIGEVSDGESPNVMIFSLDEKPLKIKKHKGRFVITEDLANNQTIDTVQEYLREVRQDLGFSLEKNAIDTLVNGDAAVSSAPVIGVESTSNKHTQIDIDRVVTRLEKMNKRVDYVITSETLALKDMNSHATSRDYMTVGNYLGQDRIFTSAVPTGTLILGSRTAMKEFTYKSLVVDSGKADDRGNIMATVTIWAGFAIFKRDARVVLDTAQAWVANTSTDFPAYMDIYGQISNS